MRSNQKPKLATSTGFDIPTSTYAATVHGFQSEAAAIRVCNIIRAAAAISLTLEDSDEIPGLEKCHYGFEMAEEGGFYYRQRDVAALVLAFAGINAKLQDQLKQMADRIPVDFIRSDTLPDVPAGVMRQVLAVVENKDGRASTIAAYYLNAYPLECDNPPDDAIQDDDGSTLFTGWFYDESNFDYDNCYHAITQKVLAWADLPNAVAALESLPDAPEPATPEPAKETIKINGRVYRKFIEYPEDVDDGTLRCIACGQIDEPEYHDESLCIAAGYAPTKGGDA